MAREEAVYEGKNLDDAVRKGLADLGLTRAEVMITVIAEGSGKRVDVDRQEACSRQGQSRRRPPSLVQNQRHGHNGPELRLVEEQPGGEPGQHGPPSAPERYC